MKRLTFEEFKHCVRAELMLKKVPIEELPRLEVIQEMYNEHRTVENAAKKILKLKEEEKNDKSETTKVFNEPELLNFDF